MYRAELQRECRRHCPVFVPFPNGAHCTQPYRHLATAPSRDRHPSQTPVTDAIITRHHHRTATPQPAAGRSQLHQSPSSAQAASHAAAAAPRMTAPHRRRMTSPPTRPSQRHHRMQPRASCVPAQGPTVSAVRGRVGDGHVPEHWAVSAARPHTEGGQGHGVRPTTAARLPYVTVHGERDVRWNRAEPSTARVSCFELSELYAFKVVMKGHTTVRVNIEGTGVNRCKRTAVSLLVLQMHRMRVMRH